MAIIEPFLPFADLFVIIVYKSPFVKAVSSIDIRSPMFSGNSNQSSAWSFCFQLLKPLNEFLY